ncbi:MAG: sigma-54 dependent transcriptional regulator [Planctomycetota bacterium]
MSESAKPRVLIVDDEPSVGELLTIVLRNAGCEVDAVTDGLAAIRKAEAAPPDVVLQDMRMPGKDGLDLLREFKKRDPTCQVIMITAYASWESAVEAMRLGAYDYVQKPFDNEVIKAVVARAAAQRRWLQDGSSAGGEGLAATNIIGASPAMTAVHDLIRRIAPADSTVLVQGESGTGKELVARALHQGSYRSREPFIPINCGAFTESLLESELFGHVRGAFTGAVTEKKGLLEVADGGTLLLDEVGEMSPATQSKLLRVLEEREFIPVGGTKRKRLDVRFVAATNRDLAEDVRRGRFRADLFYRLNVIPIYLPALRDRPDDIPLLAGHFLSVHSRAFGKSTVRFSPEAMELLKRHRWPGNVRELSNILQRAIALSEGPEIQVSDLESLAPAAARPILSGSSSISLEDHLAKIERECLTEALARAGGVQTKAADILGLTYRQLRHKLKKYGISAKGDADDGGED